MTFETAKIFIDKLLNDEYDLDKLAKDAEKLFSSMKGKWLLSENMKNCLILAKSIARWWNYKN